MASRRSAELLSALAVVAPGTPLPAPQGVFPRYVEEAAGDPEPA